MPKQSAKHQIQFILDAPLTATEKLVGVALAMRSDPQGYFDANLKDIVESTSLSEVTIRNKIKFLEGNRYIEFMYKQEGVPCYKFTCGFFNWRSQ